MNTEKATAEAKTKRLSLEDFKLEKLGESQQLAAEHLSNVYGGVAQEIASITFCGPPPTMDDCHS